MSPIQLILTLLLTIAAATYFRRLRSRFLGSLLVLTIGMLGILMIVMPNVTTLIAHALGVGRGTDLEWHVQSREPASRR